MKKFRQFTEELISEGGGDSMPADDMTISELKIACYAAQNILDKLENGGFVQRWQISAIVKAKEELASVYTSMSADEVEDDDSDEMDWDDEDEEPMYVGFEYPSMYGEEAEVRKAGPAKLVSYGPKGNLITASKIATHLHKRASDYTGGNAKLIHDLASEVEKHGDTSANDLIGKHKMIAKKVGMDAKAAHNLISGVASSLKEEAEQIDEISDKLKARYLDKAVQQRYDRFVTPRNSSAPKLKGAAKKAADAAREKANAKDTRRADIIDKTSEKLTGKPHYNKMSTMTTPAVHGNTNDWWKGKKYSKE